MSGAVRLGDPTRPRALRIYVAAGGSIALPAGSVLAGNLYAPLRRPAPHRRRSSVFGAVVVNRVNGAARSTVHHDLRHRRRVRACDD